VTALRAELLLRTSSAQFYHGPPFTRLWCGQHCSHSL